MNEHDKVVILLWNSILISIFVAIRFLYSNLTIELWFQLSWIEKKIDKVQKQHETMPPKKMKPNEDPNQRSVASIFAKRTNDMEADVHESKWSVRIDF